LFQRRRRRLVGIFTRYWVLISAGTSDILTEFLVVSFSIPDKYSDGI
jgi:hypothetical protein